MSKNFHWYDKNGNPCFEVPNKSKPGEMRPTTLRDARTLNLLPSVTSIAQVVFSYGLEEWKKYQIIKAAWLIDKCPMQEEWEARVLGEADKISQDARDTGSQIHDAVAEYLTTGKFSGQYEAWQRTFAKWWDEFFKTLGGVNVGMITEGYITTEFGYGGRYDIFVEMTINETERLRILFDIKTQKVKDKKKGFIVYRSWGRQLSAYKQPLNVDQIINIMIDSEDSSLIDSYKWTDCETLLNEFNASFLLWKSENNYEPKI